MRPMRLFKREVKDIHEIETILKTCDTVRIGAADEDGIFVVPMNYGYELVTEDAGHPILKIYVHSAYEGRKAEAFKKEPAVAFEMDCGHEIIRGDYTCSYSYAYMSIMGSGVIRELTDPGMKEYGLKKLMAHMAPEADLRFSPEVLSRTCVFCIESDQFTGKKRAPKN